MAWRDKAARGDLADCRAAQKALQEFRAAAARAELARREAAVKAEMARRRRAAGW